MKRYLEIGKITAVQGIKGEVRVEAWCDSPEFLCGLKTLYFDGGKTPLKITRAYPRKNSAVIKIKGVDSPDEAQKLISKTLFMDKSDVILEKGCYFIQDIIGLSVKDIDDGTDYGVICDVTRTGANDVYHIKDKEGRIRLIPAIPDVIKEIDVTGGLMLIRPLPSLFE